MLIDPTARPEELRERGLRWWSDGNFSIGWKGHLFLAGHPGGEASVDRLGTSLRERELAEIAPEILGVYGLFVYEHRSRRWQVCSDNSGLYRIFHDERGASTSFLDLLTARRVTTESIRPEAVVEYLTYGAWIGPSTPVRGVSRLTHDAVLVIQPDRPVAVVRKHLVCPATDDTGRVFGYFDDLARSLEGLTVSVDVTAGYDSRVVTSLLFSKGVPFEAAVSGHPGSDDAEIGRRIAEVLRRPFHLSSHTLSTLAAEIPALYVAGDGITDLRRFHRDDQNARARLARGVDVIVHGGGGELFKDQYSYQDFPFYGRSRVDLERYYDLRMSPIALPRQYLTEAAAGVADRIRPRAVEIMKGLVAPTNNESYNRFWFFLRAPDHMGQFFSNYINMGLDVAAPFLDYRNAHVGMRLPPWQTVFTRWHRSVITRACPEIAILPTSDGYTASSRWLDLPRNLTGYANVQLRRAAKKVAQRKLGRTMFHKAGAFAADAPSFMASLRESVSFRSAVDSLKAAGILRQDLALDGIRDIHVGRAFTMGMLYQRLGEPSHAHDASHPARTRREYPSRERLPDRSIG